MANVNSPIQLRAFAAEHGIDLAEYHHVLAELETSTPPFVDAEVPFADTVLLRLRTGISIREAVAAARQEMLDLDRRPDS